MVWNEETTIRTALVFRSTKTIGIAPVSHSLDISSIGIVGARVSPGQCSQTVSAQATRLLRPSNSQTLNKAKAVQEPRTALAARQALGVRGRIKDKSPVGQTKGWSCRSAGAGRVFGDEQ